MKSCNMLVAEFRMVNWINHLNITLAYHFMYSISTMLEDQTPGNHKRYYQQSKTRKVSPFITLLNTVTWPEVLVWDQTFPIQSYIFFGEYPVILDMNHLCKTHTRTCIEIHSWLEATTLIDKSNHNFAFDFCTQD